MEFGVNLPTSGAAATLENIVKVAGWAEELGFHSLWASDHVVLPERVDAWYPYAQDKRWPYPADTNWLDPLLALAWAAQAAPHCKLGTNVLVVPLRDPMLLAKQTATLDYLSGGRLLLGIGAGWMEEEFKLLGVPFADRGARTAEMVRLMRAFWSGAKVDFKGKYWQVADCLIHPLPVRRSVPIYWGGHSEAALRHVARVGDGWLPLGLSMVELRAGIELIRAIRERLPQTTTEVVSTPRDRDQQLPPATTEVVTTPRDPNGVPVVVRPGTQYKVDAERLEEHQALGVTHWIVDNPSRDPAFQALHDEMLRVAELCQLPARKKTLNG
jgi:probable F420-dependent oxidoreductase